MRLIIIFSILTLLLSGCASTTKSGAETKRPASTKEFHLRERI